MRTASIMEQQMAHAATTITTLNHLVYHFSWPDEARAVRLARAMPCLLVALQDSTGYSLPLERLLCKYSATSLQAVQSVPAVPCRATAPLVSTGYDLLVNHRDRLSATSLQPTRSVPAVPCLPTAPMGTTGFSPPPDHWLCRCIVTSTGSVHVGAVVPAHGLVWPSSTCRTPTRLP